MKSPLNILLVEDSLDDVQLILFQLEQEGIEVQYRRVDTEVAFTAALASPPDLILSDFSMPKFSGLRALKILRELALDIPFILVSGTIGEEVAVEAMKDGADDYLMKDRLIRLGTAIQIALNQKQLRDEKIQADIALRDNEARFRSLIENGVDEISIISADGSLMYESPSANPTLGYPKGEFLHKSLLELVHPDDLGRFQNQFAKLLRNPAEHPRQRFRLRHRNGRWIWVEGVGTNLLHEPSVLGIVVNYHDVTDIVETEEALRSSEEQYRSLFEDSPIALWVEDFSEVKKRLDQLKQENIFDIPAYIREHPEFVSECANQIKVIDVNRAAIDLYDAENKVELLGSLSSKAISISPEEFEYELTQLANGHLSFEREGTDKTLDGNLINVTIHWTVVPGYEETLEKVIVSTVDITERKQAEQKIRRQVKYLKALHDIDLAISSTFDMKFSLDALLNETILHLEVNAVSILLFNQPLLTLEYVVGKGFRSSVIEQTRIRVDEGLAGLAALERRTVHVDNLNEVGNGFTRTELLKEEGFVAYYALPLTSKGELKGVLEVFHREALHPEKAWLDFLETLAGQAAIAIDNAQLFENLQSSNIRLERRVTERTAQLNKTNIELEHANRAKDEFLANMSHELRTPLNSILGLSESLLEQHRDSLTQSQQKSLQVIESSGKHLLDLINDVLDLAKIEAGKFDYYPQSINVNDLCKSSQIFVKAQAMKKNITLTYEIEDAISDFYGDPRRLKQILVNLLTNAVKFTPERGEVTLKVNTNAEKEVIRFSVIDTGIGITQENLRRLFTPFVQVESSLNRNFEGTGLGLALVQKLTDLHGGSVEVESEVGKGSRFTINLPYTESSAEIPQEENKILPPTEIQIDFEPKTEKKNKRILLVEDNEANVLTIGEYLENHGYEIVIANDGVQAIEKAEQTLPDVILMDMQMPVMDGLEATRRLRADVRFAKTPIIALTALAMPGDRERCLEAGVTEYMSKPVSLKELRKTIESFLIK